MDYSSILSITNTIDKKEKNSISTKEIKHILALINDIFSPKVYYNCFIISDLQGKKCTVRTLKHAHKM